MTPEKSAEPSSINKIITTGWREIIALPEWNIPRLRAKLDTGAKTSALHVRNIEYTGNDMLRFEVVIRERPRHDSIWITAKQVRESRVRPSSGHHQNRPVVITPMLLGGLLHEIEISLVCRKGMLCRMLIGRTALAPYYVVDSSRKYIVSSLNRKKSGSSSKRRSKS